MINFEKKRMNIHLEYKAETLKNHFYSTKIGVKEFCQMYHSQYGYASWFQLKKFMVKNSITLANKSKNYIDNSMSVNKIVYNFDLLDNYGIAESLSKEYESAKLPDHLKKIGILSDIHFPYHSLEALSIAIKYLKVFNIDCLYLNGDILDFYSISRHEKDPDLRDFKREVDMSREFLQKLRDIFPTIPIYYKLGNHEQRYARSLQVQAEEFAQIHDLQFDIFFHLDKLQFTIVNDWQGMEMGDLLVVHGHEMYGAGGVNPSQNLMNKTLCNTLMGHVHRTSTTQKKNAFKEYINTYTTGCLTVLSPKYMPFSQHNHGFALVEINEGKSKVTNLMIKEGKVV
jgi:UDP-2,3-diacylglucosamine pyrophosphatase LpxH